MDHHHRAQDLFRVGLGLSRVLLARPAPYIQGPRVTPAPPPAHLHESEVPESAVSRVAGFGALAGQLAWAKASGADPNLVLAQGLCRMRGAALKLGQMLSLADGLSPEAAEALGVMRDAAHRLPGDRVRGVLAEQLGGDWETRITEFEDRPIAAASIGQVHTGVVGSSTRVAVKVQYPGVARSIHSDLDNLSRVLSMANILPKGLFLRNILEFAKAELVLECDYEAEARHQARFRELLADEPGVYVPQVYPSLSTKSILVTELVPGLPLDQAAATLPQHERNRIASTILRVSLRELFEFRVMQTDPNWSNYLYDPHTRVLNLIDFGATREYSADFVTKYLAMVHACALQHRPGIIEHSLALGLLNGKESPSMLDKHVESAMIVGTPFAEDREFDFGATDMSARLHTLARHMLRERVAPPPPEIYSLHRKLSGAFLACIRLRAVIPCRRVFMEIYEEYGR